MRGKQGNSTVAFFDADACCGVVFSLIVESFKSLRFRAEQGAHGLSVRVQLPGRPSG